MPNALSTGECKREFTAGEREFTTRKLVFSVCSRPFCGRCAEKLCQARALTNVTLSSLFAKAFFRGTPAPTSPSSPPTSLSHPTAPDTSSASSQRPSGATTPSIPSSSRRMRTPTTDDPSEWKVERLKEELRLRGARLYDFCANSNMDLTNRYAISKKYNADIPPIIMTTTMLDVWIKFHPAIFHFLFWRKSSQSSLKSDAKKLFFPANLM